MEDAALSEFLTYLIRTDAYSQIRFIATADEINRLRAIAPAIPRAIAACEKQAAELRVEIRAIAADAGLDLARVLYQIRQEALDCADGRVHRYFESGWLEF